MYHTSRAKGTRRAALPPFGANTLLLEFGLCSPYALSGVPMIKPAHEKVSIIAAYDATTGLATPHKMRWRGHVYVITCIARTI